MVDPLVSIIIPTYYRNEVLSLAIESALRQTYNNIEIIVVDDSGEAHGESIARSYDVEYIPHENNKGGNPARNTGIKQAEGKYIQLLDDDDLLCPDKITKQVNLLKDSHTTGVAFCGIIHRDGTFVIPDKRHRGDVLDFALAISLPASYTSTLLIDSTVMDSIYPLTDRKAADDVGMKIELAKQTKFDYVPEPLVEIRDSEENRSNSIDYADEIEKIISEYDILYNQYPPHIKRSALVTLNRQRGRWLLTEQQWSLVAILSFLRVILYNDGINVEDILEFIASLFGRPGYRFASQVNRWLS